VHPSTWSLLVLLKFSALEQMHRYHSPFRHDQTMGRVGDTRFHLMSAVQTMKALGQPCLLIRKLYIGSLLHLPSLSHCAGSSPRFCPLALPGPYASSTQLDCLPRSYLLRPLSGDSLNPTSVPRPAHLSVHHSNLQAPMHPPDCQYRFLTPLSVSRH